MFQLKQVACAYEQKKVFTGLDLEIRQGQYVMLMGENGTGKSSLISLLTGFKQEESGRILFLGKDLKEWLKDKRQKRDFYSRLGILFQDVDSQLFNSTVYDEIAFGPRQLGLTEEEVSQRLRIRYRGQPQRYGDSRRRNHPQQPQGGIRQGIQGKDGTCPRLHLR